ncbi:hypothetical protein D3C81_1074830 [compost metagenome]
MLLLSILFMLNNSSLKLSFVTIAISAAEDGVAALMSATKSHIVKSTSCPTADITGVLDL